MSPKDGPSPPTKKVATPRGGSSKDIPSHRASKDNLTERKSGAFLKSSSKDEAGSSKDVASTPRGEKKKPKGKAVDISGPADTGMDPAAKAALNRRRSIAQIADIAPMIVATEAAAAIKACAMAAKDKCLADGDSPEKAEAVYNAAKLAAIAVLDPSGSAHIGDADEVSTVDKIENTLARALKVNAVRVKDLFLDWDVEHSGEISRKNFRDALRGIGFGGSKKDHDEVRTGGQQHTQTKHMPSSLAAIAPRSLPSLPFSRSPSSCSSSTSGTRTSPARST